jgi:hypothetical protein
MDETFVRGVQTPVQHMWTSSVKFRVHLIKPIDKFVGYRFVLLIVCGEKILDTLLD